MCEARKRLVTRGLAVALERKKQERPSVERLFDGGSEARLIALACSQPPEGRGRWTLQLLSDKVVELQIVPHCTANTIHEVLKKKRTQASSQGMLGNSPGTRCSICRRHGGCAGGIPPPL